MATSSPTKYVGAQLSPLADVGQSVEVTDDNRAQVEYYAGQGVLLPADSDQAKVLAGAYQARQDAQAPSGTAAAPKADTSGM